jgi:hypothetical protein
MLKFSSKGDILMFDLRFFVIDHTMFIVSVQIFAATVFAASECAYRTNSSRSTSLIEVLTVWYKVMLAIPIVITALINAPMITVHSSTVLYMWLMVTGVMTVPLVSRYLVSKPLCVPAHPDMSGYRTGPARQIMLASHQWTLLSNPAMAVGLISPWILYVAIGYHSAIPYYWVVACMVLLVITTALSCAFAGALCSVVGDYRDSKRAMCYRVTCALSRMLILAMHIVTQACIIL